MTLKTMGTKYVSVNTYRPFLVSPENVYGSSALNNYHPSLTRTDHYAGVGPQGPRCLQWLTWPASHMGSSQCAGRVSRARSLAHQQTASKRLRLSSSGPQECLPATTVGHPGERTEQRETRAKQYMLRCLGTPCEVGGDLDKPY